MSVVFVVIGLVTGVAVGYIVPLRWFGNQAGFEIGVLCAVLVTVLIAMATAFAVGGLGEGYLGTTFGVPLGVAIGALLGTMIVNCVAGIVGVALARVLNERHRLAQCGPSSSKPVSKLPNCIMSKLLGIASLLVFALSAVVHLLTFIPSLPVSPDATWPLHLASLTLFGAMFLHLGWQQRRQRQREPVRPVTGFFARWRAAIQQNEDFQEQQLHCIPRPVRVFGAGVVIYASINFVLFMILMEGGGPSVENGKYYLHDHGRKIRDLSKEEYQRFLAYEVRGFSGHWMVFSMCPAVYFLTICPTFRQSMHSDPIAPGASPLHE